MKNVEEIYEDILKYINQEKHNRPSTLASIKKGLRTPKIIDLIFSRPDVFNLEAEIKHVPEENLTEDVVVKYVLSNPKNFIELDEKLQTLPVMIAFEYSKRRYEHISSMMWGGCGERIPYTDNIKKYKNQISDMCDNLNEKYNDIELMKNLVKTVDVVSKSIMRYCKSVCKDLEEEKKYIKKYGRLQLEEDKKLMILVSGQPDSGKTTFSRVLSAHIEDSICFDSDMLLERNILDVPLCNLVRDDAKAVIFSDIYAYKFFNEKELKDYEVVNIIINPVSIEKRYRNSKYMQNIPFEEYKKREGEEIKYNLSADYISVTNYYSEETQREIDKVLEIIASKFGGKLEQSEEIKKVNSNNKFCKR